MKNNKAFTLVEVIGIIVILSVIMVIAVPTIISTLQSSEEKSYKTFLDNIYIAAETYVEANIEMFNFGSESNDYILVSELIDSAYINGNMMNPKTKEEVKKESSVLEISKSIDGIIEFKYIYSGLDSLVLVDSIEDLVKLSVAVNNGEPKTGLMFHLTRDLDFLDTLSYTDAIDTSYGDINGNGTVETIKEEVTTGKGFKPIGTSLNKFEGSFYGRNKSIKNLYINRPDEEDVGLFGSVESGLINSLVIEAGSVTGKNKVGLGVGSAYLAATIEDIEATGSINGMEYSIGGLVGLADGSLITSSRSGVNINGISTTENGVGGIVGSLQMNGEIKNSLFTGNIESQSLSTGGIVGFLEASVANNNIFDGNVSMNNSSSYNVGGIIGEAKTSSKVLNSVAIGNIVATGDKIGGIVGSINNSSVSNCYSASDIVGNNEVGGIIGYALNNAEISNVYSSGAIEGSNYIGGIIGVSTSANLDIGYSIAPVRGSSYVGGVIGSIASASVTNNAYATGNIIRETQYASGAVGYIEANYSGSHSDVYYYDDQSYMDFSGATFTPDVTVGQIVTRSDLITTVWQQNILQNHFSYSEGKHPKLYKRDNNGNPTNVLLSNQQEQLID